MSPGAVVSLFVLRLALAAADHPRTPECGRSACPACAGRNDIVLAILEAAS